MNTKSCPNCGLELPLDARRCSNCGTIFLATGRLEERGISRTRAILIGIVLLLFPLCCLGSVGYRLVSGDPPDFESVFSKEEGGESEPLSGGIISFLERVFGGDEDTMVDVLEEANPTFTIQVGQEVAAVAAPSETTEPEEDNSQATDTPKADDVMGIPDIPELACVPRNTDRQEAEVIQVIDGDEIRVRIGEEEFIVRYIGILAPEITDSYGPESSNENIYQVFSKQVLLVRDVTDVDEEGRLIRYVIQGDRLINHHMVIKGLAQAENTAPDTACSDLLQSAEAVAQQENAGLWGAAPEPTRTWAPLWTETPDESTGGNGGGNPNCNCSGPDLDCGDFDSQAEAQICFLKCILDGDVFNLDPNDNGIACDE